MDELDARIRSLEAERLRPTPGEPEPTPPPPGETRREPERNTTQRVRRAVSRGELDENQARRIRRETGSVKAVMDRLGLTYAEAKRLTDPGEEQ